MASTLQADEQAQGDQRRQQRRGQIVEAATQLFAELGYADCEMERVAARLKVAKGTLYLYFKSKEELFYACVDQAMVELQAAVNAAAEKVDDPLQKIPAAIRAYLEFFDANPQYVELFIQERANFRDRQRPSYFKHRDANRGPWRELYRGLIEAGRLRDDMPVERLLDAIGNLMYGTMFTNRFAGRSISIDDQFDSLMKIIFRGILAQRETA
jgi:AcrR family transcriptional regulator